MKQRSALAGLFAFVFLAPSAASAASADPPALVAQLMLAAPPPCTLCHEPADAGEGPATTPFARSLTARGFHDDDPSSLARALSTMKTDDVDSDGDGATDLDELSWGGDPNVASLPAAATADDGPKTGCQVVSGGGGLDAALLVTLAALVGRRSRSRRRSA